MLIQDPIRLDRSLAEFARSCRRFQAALVGADGSEHSFEDAPAGLDEELLDLFSKSRERDPFLAGAERWLGFLLVEQAAISEARAVAFALMRERHALELPEKGEFTLAELRGRALRETPRADDWMRPLAARAAELSARRFALWERRREARERLQVDSEPAPGIFQCVPKLALSFLEATDAAYSELAIRSWRTLLERGLGAEVAGEWPTRINTRTLAELLREADWLEGISPEPFEKAKALGASSVMRGLGAFGRALHDASAGRRLPFVVAQAPAALRRSAAGALFALLPCDADFATRRLGVGRVRCPDYLRQLRAILLIGSRQSALRALLEAGHGLGPKAFRERFVELFQHALGFEAAPALAGVVFAGDHARTDFAGLLLAAERDDQLTERYDQDWYRNPRGSRELRAEYEAPPAGQVDPAELQAGVHRLVQALCRDS